MSGEPSVLTWLPLLGSLALKSLFVFLVAGAALLALRRASASARHLVCLLALVGLLALPLLSLALPGWRLAVLAAPAHPNEASNSGGAVAEPVGAQFIAPSSEAPPAPNSGGARPDGEARGDRSAPSSGSPLTPSPSLAPPELGAGGASPRSPWPLFLLTLWLAGILLAALRPLLGLWGIARLSQTSTAVLDAPTLALTAECASALGLTQAPALRQADAPVPMTWGWRHPVVLLPAEASGWPEGRLRAVLLHELAHVRRRDWLSHRLADVVCALYWFHPLAWLTARRLKMEGEIACDDLVLTSGVAAPDYARHLLDVARALRPAAVPQVAIAMARTARIEGRLTMILDTTRPRRALTRRALLTVLSLSAAALVPLAVLHLEARAQAAPPTAVTHRHLITLYGTAATPIVGTAGMIVQLAGVADPAARKWWGVNGTPLPRPVFALASASNSDGPLVPMQRRVQLAFRLPLVAQGVTVKYALTNCLYSSSGGSWPSKIEDHDRQTEAQLNVQTGGARILTATFPASVTRTNVRVGTASGPWKVIGTARRDASGRIEGLSVQRENTGYIFSPLAETKEGTMLTFSMNAAGSTAEDLRIVAVDTQGREVFARRHWRQQHRRARSDHRPLRPAARPDRGHPPGNPPLPLRRVQERRPAAREVAASEDRGRRQTMKRRPYELALWAALPMAHTTRIEGRLRMILDAARPHHALTRRALLVSLAVAALGCGALAALQPGTRALAAGAPSVWKQTLANGATVEVLGVSNAPTRERGGWWKPDGTPLAGSPFGPPMDSPVSGRNRRAFAMRVTSPRGGPKWQVVFATYEVPGAAVTETSYGIASSYSGRIAGP